jgi:hypothetical protein
VLRIRADDPTAELPLGSKYGANIDEVYTTCTMKISIYGSQYTPLLLMLVLLQDQR